MGVVAIPLMIAQQCDREGTGHSESEIGSCDSSGRSLVPVRVRGRALPGSGGTGRPGFGHGKRLHGRSVGAAAGEGRAMLMELSPREKQARTGMGLKFQRGKQNSPCSPHTGLKIPAGMRTGNELGLKTAGTSCRLRVPHPTG